ncbi:MAG: site-specific DNA-methyltransferase [Candidatus Binataceae bacterium]
MDGGTQNPPSPDKSGRRVAVVYRPLADLRMDPGNPRAHSPRQVRQIARSIETFGFNVPVLIDSKLQVIAGHGRILASRLLAWSEVPTICLDHLTEAQARAFMIADNRLTENSIWNDQLLAEQLRDLSLLELDFSLEVTGFEMGEIDLRIESLTSESEEDPDDAIPAGSVGPVVSRVGDLWLLGNHALYCGSALDEVSYSVLMGGEKAAMVFADPPYNVRIEGNVSGLGAIHHREFAMASGEMTEAEFTGFLSRACTLLARHSAGGSIHFICIDWRHMTELLAAGRQAYTELKNVCVWAKNNPGMGSLYRSQHELVFVYKSGSGRHRNNIQLGQFGRNRGNVWRYPGANSFAQQSDEGNLLALHPTVKPVAMVADAILDCSARGDIVLDNFLGSGTTVIAAERTGRRCYGLEIDPLYTDTIVRRWQALTGDDARHASRGKTFNQLEAEARDLNGKE